MNSPLNDKIYLDNNATTFMHKNVIKELLIWTNKGNASSSYADGVECKNKILEAKKYIADICKFNLDDFYIIFNSGASEGNAYIFRGVAESYFAIKKTIPNIITSAIEHKSIISCLKDLESLGKITATFIAPDKLGFIHPDDVEQNIKKETAIISVMSANNETGVINDILNIGRIAHKHNIPIHVDCTQSFGKSPLNPENIIDAFNFSFHKLHGPQFLGCLVIRKDFFKGYDLKPLIAGSQNDGLRGGTENTALIASAELAMKQVFNNRINKNELLLKKKLFIMDELAKHIPCKSLSDYWNEKLNKYHNSIEIVFISDSDPHRYLCNTLLLSVVKRTQPPICNSVMKKMLEEKNIIVSVGSACNTQSKSASHVVYAMGFDDLLKKGILRISLCDDTSFNNVKIFIVEFLTVIKFCIKDTCDLKSQK